MLHLNEDNNDDLFRKAAEDFFLKADNPDWDDLISKMHNPAIASTNDTTGIKEKKYLFGTVFFKWMYATRAYKALSSFFHPFRRGPWPEKSKKKIEPVLYTMDRRLQLSRYFALVLYLPDAGCLTGH